MMRVSEIAIRRLFSQQEIDEIINESMYRYLKLDPDNGGKPSEVHRKYLELGQVPPSSKRNLHDDT